MNSTKKNMRFSKISQLLNERDSRRVSILRNIVFVITFLSSFMAVVTWIDNDFNSNKTSILLTFTSLFNLNGYYFLRKKLFLHALILLSTVAFSTLYLNMLFGNGIHDPGVVAYPLIIFVGRVLFTNKAIPWYTFFSIFSVTIIA